MGDATRKMYAAEDAAEGCWMEAPHVPKESPIDGPGWVLCARCHHPDYSGDPWFQCRMCGQLHKPEDDDD